ncbi:MAG: cobyrinate a,c-diamide synthase [Nocardioidaceae bacterium]
MVTRLPRIVVAAPASGHGKTTVATGLMAALRRAGHRVSGHKVGPDYIDPGYHALATGRPGRNLDPHLVGEERIAPLLLHGAGTPEPADVAVIEGVMGLYDGAIGGDGFASTAHVARLLDAPVLLVVDVSQASRSIAAVVHGMAAYDPSVALAGVILNKVGSDRHADEVRSAVEATGVPVVGVLSRHDGIAAPSRHLGLVPAEDRADAATAVDRLATQLRASVDLDAIMRIAHRAGDLNAAAWTAPVPDAPVSVGPVIAVAGGRAFTFRYAETEELLRAAGCRPAIFDPMADEALPEGTAGIYLGGGFPEVHASGLTANAPMREELRRAVSLGIPTVAECAGLLYLGRSLDGRDMVGALDATAVMSPRLTLSYRTATALSDSIVAARGEQVTGHEFHRTRVTCDSDTDAAWSVDGAGMGFVADPTGAGYATVHASYLHLHWAGLPTAAERFAASAQQAVGRYLPRTPTGTRVRLDEPSTSYGGVDLHHHGDAEVRAGIVDLAVNVQRIEQPEWLCRALDDVDLRRYPSTDTADSAIAHRHLRDADEVLPTAGGAEAFTLVARARRWRLPVVVHPQFTEPEAALDAAGHTVRRVVLDAGDAFALDPTSIPESADLVVLGNPTNPTGSLHPAAVVSALTRPGRVVVVDEAFMDAVPGEPQSVASLRLPGLVVVRSLTKTWAIPGLRAGYVVGDAEVIRDLAGQQPPWSVSAPALAAIVACCQGRARAEAERRASAIEADRRVLVDGLDELGVVVNPSMAPFVLANTRGRLPAGARPGHVRSVLRARGFGVRRCDTFPGLDADWIRVAVRDAETSRALLAALTETLAPVGVSR